MNSQKKDRALDEFVKEVREKHGNKVEKIIIYGSYARGESTEESDIDVLVVGDVTLDEMVDISFPLLLKHGVYISPHVMTGDHFSHLDREGYGFVKNVKREGREVHA
jgi:predicted nucleotidyltransferase